MISLSSRFIPLRANTALHRQSSLKVVQKIYSRVSLQGIPRLNRESSISLTEAVWMRWTIYAFSVILTSLTLQSLPPKFDASFTPPETSLKMASGTRLLRTPSFSTPKQSCGTSQAGRGVGEFFFLPFKRGWRVFHLLSKFWKTCRYELSSRASSRIPQSVASRMHEAMTFANFLVTTLLPEVAEGYPGVFSSSSRTSALAEANQTKHLERTISGMSLSSRLMSRRFNTTSSINKSCKLLSQS
mmetsp:Transcript_3643/g.9143  ORF Transcript_3643/g.9143 Transcript_3643/m.9143 type:complete len:243 (-) Transcript_3643:12-740(-)